MSYTMEPIGLIHSPFKEKFGLPRQAGLIPESEADLELLPPYDHEEALRGLAAFSHLWLIFIFHANPADRWSPTVRPPRLGGNRRLGLFATRSPFRPNRLGLSAVKLNGFGRQAGKLLLHLQGADLLDGTPVLDIKPYLPYADAIPQAAAGFAPDKPEPPFRVEFSPQAETFCREADPARYPNLGRLIGQVLQSDPRPAYYTVAAPKDHFYLRLFDLQIVWTVRDETVMVNQIGPAGAE